MKFNVDERVKHRIVGLVVILSLATIFIPPVVKKSNRYFEANNRLSVKLPAKPIAPKVVVKSEKAVFETVKIAHVAMPKLVEPLKLTQIAKAEPISVKSIIPAAPQLNQAVMVAKAEEVIVTPKPQAKNQAVITPIKKEMNKELAKRQIYAVQLASFSQQDNAKSLVNRLRNKGYVATYNKSTGKQGDIYKVLVGQVYARDEAQILQKKLAESMQLNGFIVKAG
jgi:DedD protein